MKGIVFNLLEEAVTSARGPDVWDDLLARASSDGSFTSLGNYPTDELVRIVDAAADAWAMPPDDVLRWFGRAAIPMFAERYPRFFDAHTTTSAFLLTLNDIIHPEVRKLYPGAKPPTFVFDRRPNGVRMTYVSPRRLCALADGLVRGAAAHFGDAVTVVHESCVKSGAAACVLDIALRPAD